MEWYDNKALFERIESLQKDMGALQKELAETRVLIHDYNKLREKLEDLAGKVTMLFWLTPVTIAALGLLFTFLTYIGR